MTYLNNITMIAETFIYMPIYHKAEMTRKKILHQTKKAHFFVLPLMALIFTPRILNLVLFFGVWRGFGCFVTFFGAVTIYTIGYVTLVFTKYKKEWNTIYRHMVLI